MTSEFGEKLIAAFQENRANVNNFIWKGPKKKNPKTGAFEQLSTRLVDASEQQLKDFYNYCKVMLFNTDKKIPGRVTLLKEISKQKDLCGVELFYRDGESKKTSRFSVVDAIRTRIAKSNYSQPEIDSLTIGDLISTSGDFSNLPTKLIVDGGLDKLGRFDRSHITLTFILKQGLWFSKEESLMFNEIFEPEFTKFDKLRVIKKKLALPEDVKLYFNPLGLTYSQLKSILSLRSKKYSDLSLEQLKTLRYKLLFALEDEVNLHIAQWNDRMGQIETVAELKNFKLN